MDDIARHPRPDSREEAARAGARHALELAAADLCRSARASACWISAASAGEAEVLAAHGRPRPPSRPVGARWRVADVPPAQQALSTRRTVSVVGRADPRLSDDQRSVWYGNGDGTSVAVLPLVVGDEVVGLVELADRSPRDLTARLDDQQGLLRLVADLVALSRQLAAAERRAGDLALILDADIEAQSRAAGSEQVLRVVARRLSALCRAPAVDISAVERDRLHTVVSWNDGAFDHAVEGVSYPLADWPVTRAAVTAARTQVLHDLGDDRLDAAAVAEMQKWGVASLLAVPLVVQGTVIGVAEVYDRQPRDFSDEAEAATVLAEVAAHILDRALLVEALEAKDRATRELLELGARVARAKRPLDLADYVAGRLLDVTGGVCCEVSRTERGELRVLVSLDTRPGMEDPDATAVVDLDNYPSVVDAARRHELLVIESPDDPRLSEVERAMYERWGFASQLSIPLLVDERLIGIIEVFDDKERDFSEHLDFARGVGQMVAGAFSNALLLEQLGETNAELRTLVDAGLEFGASLDLDAVLRSVAVRMCLASEAATCDIYTVEDTRIVGLVSADGAEIDEDFPGTTWPLAEFPVVARAIEEGEPVAVADIATDPRVGRREREEDLAWGYRSMLEMPLIHRGEVIGVAVLFSRETREFAGKDLLRGLGHIAAQAIANARVHRLLDESSRRAALINEAGLDLTASLDPQRVLAAAARRLCDIARVDSCDVYTLTGDELTCAASILGGAPDDARVGRTLPLADWRAARLASDSRSAVTVTEADDPRLASVPAADGGQGAPRTALIVPLVVENRVIGLAELFDTARRRAFGDEDVAGAEALCRVAALAVANAELFADLELRSRETDLLNRIAAITTASLDPGDIATATVGALTGLVRFDEVCVVIDGVGEWRVVYSSLPDVESLATAMDGVGARGVLQRLEEERATLVDLEREPLFGAQPDDDRRLRSALVVGLWSEERLSGALVLASQRADAFSTADRRLLARVGAQLGLAFRNARLYETVKTMHVAHLKALISAMNARDSYAVGHAARVAGYVLLLGRELGWHEERLPEITEAAFLHDIGRIGVGDDVLYKPGRLSDAEMAELRHHPVVSAGIIGPLFGEDLVRAVRHHHERWDGSGYPDGLAGDDIPELARALCVVDSYDAMSYERPHHVALTYQECLDELRRCAGHQFDPGMVEAFVRVLARLDGRRAVARAAAAAAAARIDGAAHRRITSRDHEGGRDYERIAAVLREVRDAHPPVRFLTTLAPGHDGWHVVVDPEDDEDLRSHVGDPVFIYAIRGSDVASEDAGRNILQVDDFGMWLSGVADILDERGEKCGLACADVTPDDDWPHELGIGFAGAEGTFSSILEAATARLGRARVDAVTDGLTGLYNQRYFKQRLGEEIARASEQGRPLALLFCDLDRFKDFNDRHGHSAGDAALRAVAGVLLRSSRQVDLAARYGGEEFTMVLIDTTAQGAAEVAERIRGAVRALDLGDPARSLTVSIGVAAYPRDAALAEELVDKADWAMYLAKRQGRDRVVVFAPGGPQEAPGGPQEAPVAAQDAPGGPHDAPGTVRGAAHGDEETPPPAEEAPPGA